jgi:hypothetical protein
MTRDTQLLMVSSLKSLSTPRSELILEALMELKPLLLRIHLSQIFQLMN